MDYQILEMLYNIPELQDLSYQIYLQMPERIEREEYMQKLWQECTSISDPHTRDLFFYLEDAIHSDGALQERASFFTGIYLGWGLSQTMGT